MVKEVEIVTGKSVEEAEMDEMWSFVHDKSQQCWLWWAIDHQTGEPLAYCFGTREYKYLEELPALLAPFHIETVYADGNYAYEKHMGDSSTVVTGKRNTQRIEEIQAAVDGAISREQAAKLRECLQHIDELNAHKANIDREILRLAKPYSWQLDLIRTIPDFSADPITAIAVISEIGINMSVSPTVKHLVSWAGCCPRNDQSGGKVKFTRYYISFKQQRDIRNRGTPTTNA